MNIAGKRSLSEISLKLKYKVLQELDKGTPQKDLAETFSFPKNAISTWKNNWAKILACYEKGLDSKRIKPEMNENISEALMKWLLHLRSKNIHVNGLLVKEKAYDFAKGLECQIFKKGQSFSIYIFPTYKSVSNWPFNILMNFSSPVNCTVQVTFMPFTSP